MRGKLQCQGKQWVGRIGDKKEQMTTVTENIKTTMKRITEYEHKYGREIGSVKLLAASKKQSLDKLKEALQAGQMCFGESYLQEALSKLKVLAAEPIEWHFIGHIQSNKTRKIAEHFAWVHSVSDKKIAQRLNDQRPLNLLPLNICIEVNISHEETKSGVGLDEAESLANYCLNLPYLKLRGLMTIPAENHDFLEQRKEFHKLFSLFEKLREKNMDLDTLSMGMSEDFEAAIAEGATIVRLGTRIFGPRS